MKKDSYLQPKGFSLITVLLMATCLLILGLGLVGILSYEMRFLQRSTESKTVHPLAESGASSGLWRLLWGPDVFGAEGPDGTPHVPNGIPDILEEIMGINFFKNNPTDITRYGYTYTTTLDKRDIVVKIEREDYKIIPKPRRVTMDLGRNSGEIWGQPQVCDIDPNDGRTDIFVSTRNGKIYRVKYWRDENGTPKYEIVGNGPYITVPASYSVIGEPKLGDIDGDGDVELVCATSHSGWGVNAVYVYDAATGNADNNFDEDGKVLLNPGQLGVETHVDVNWEPEIADIDGNGKMEIVVCATCREHGKGYVVCLNSDGSKRWVYEGKDSHNFFISAPKIANVSGDCTKEIIARDGYGYRGREGGRIYVLDGNTGSETLRHSLGTCHSNDSWWQQEIGVGDLDNNGDYEIFVTGASNPDSPLTDPKAWTHILNPNAICPAPSSILINPRTAPFPAGFIPGPEEYHQHQSPTVIDANGDGLNDSLFFGTCKDAVFMINVDLTTGNYDYNVDNNSETGDANGNDFPRGIPGSGDVHGTPAWLNIDEDLEKEVVFTTMWASSGNNGRIIIVDYQQTGARPDFVPISDFMLPNGDRPSFNAGPVRADLDGDGLLDMLFVTSTHYCPSPGQRNFSGQIIVWHPFAAVNDEQIFYLKIISSAPMLKEGDVWTGKKKIIAHIGIMAQGRKVWIRSKEAVEDVGL